MKRELKLLDSEYATYRDDIRQFFQKEVLTESTTLIDPMAGACHLIPFFEMNGHTAYLFDILPVHLIINKAKRYPIYQYFKKNGTKKLMKQFIKVMQPLKGKTGIISENWYHEDVLHGLIKTWEKSKKLSEKERILFQAFIIKSLRYYCSSTSSHNKTWIKKGGISTFNNLDEVATEVVTQFDNYYNIAYSNYLNKKKCKKGICHIQKMNATQIKLNKPVDILITSPPYPNRLDYIRLYAPENFFLSKMGNHVASGPVIGTTIVKDYNSISESRKYIKKRSPYLNALLDRIGKKKKRDVRYYSRYYTRYFDELYKTFESLEKNVKKGGQMYIVVQDNIHRGEIIEIDKALEQLFSFHGYQSHIVFEEKRHHLGLRNVSKDNVVIRRKHPEKIMVVQK